LVVEARYHGAVRYLLVERVSGYERCAYLCAQALAQGSNNVCCVGDDDQSIYGLARRRVDNILRFEQDFRARSHPSERNYPARLSIILGAASGLIAANKDRPARPLWTEMQGGPQGPA